MNSLGETTHASASGEIYFARRFRILMGWHDLTLRQIAAATHHALSTVGTWKNGRIPASPETIECLAEIFHVPVEYLLAGQLPEPCLTTDDTAGRILQDLELLQRALEHSGGKSDVKISQRTKRARSAL